MLIWITGLPNAGKTTLANLVTEGIKKDTDTFPIHLDGDILRYVWKETERESQTEREQLGCKYVQLAQYLEEQGALVVVSAVALSAPVFEELENLDCKVIKVFIEADAQTLQHRDSRDIYNNQEIQFHIDSAHEILPPDFIILENNTDTAPAEIANKIIVMSKNEILTVASDLSAGKKKDGLEVIPTIPVNQSKSQHWKRYYEKSNTIPTQPSGFAKFLMSHYLEKSSIKFKIVDFGCGNGRDSAFFATKHSVLGVDSSQTAVDLSLVIHKELCKIAPLHFLRASHQDIAWLLADHRPNIVYTRFLLHALTNTEEDVFFQALEENMTAGSLLAIECRSTFDKLREKGIKISRNERVFGHYRRFIDSETLLRRLDEAGFSLDYFAEQDGLAVVDTEDPVVIRIVAKKI